jgi:hypothetical protein
MKLCKAVINNDSNVIQVLVETAAAVKPKALAAKQRKVSNLFAMILEFKMVALI